MKPRTLRRHRYLILKTEGFLPREAQQLSEFKFKYVYIALMRKERQEFMRNNNLIGKSITTIARAIKQLYEVKGWTDAYAMMRDYRQQTIDEGGYSEQPKGKRKPTQKGDVVAQKRRYKERKERDRRNYYDRYDTQGNVIGHTRFNYTTKKFEKID